MCEYVSSWISGEGCVHEAFCYVRRNPYHVVFVICKLDKASMILSMHHRHTVLTIEHKVISVAMFHTLEGGHITSLLLEMEH
jgi:hypothetical protein